MREVKRRGKFKSSLHIYSFFFKEKGRGSLIIKMKSALRLSFLFRCCESSAPFAACRHFPMLPGRIINIDSPALSVQTLCITYAKRATARRTHIYTGALISRTRLSDELPRQLAAFMHSILPFSLSPGQLRKLLDAIRRSSTQLFHFTRANSRK